MGKLSRRSALKQLGVATIAGVAPNVGCAAKPEPKAPTPSPTPPVTLSEATVQLNVGAPGMFQHGVASGDPTASGVVLWTRVSTGRPGPVQVRWEIADEPDFRRPIRFGSTTTSGSRDYTVKVDVDGLRPGATYFYRFRCQSRTSAVGRTRTAPSGAVDRVRLGVASCSDYSRGYFHGYRELATAPVDAILHLGDYIYEYGVPADAKGRRIHEPDHTLVTLADYRERYAQYRRDPDLAEAHRVHPFISVWDDHEFANNAWFGGAAYHPKSFGPWAARRDAAARAYHEWMPIRDTRVGRIFRRLRYGELLDILMLDTRVYGRTGPVDRAFGRVGPPPEPDPSRSLLGEEQAAWLDEQLISSTAIWKVLGQQVVFATWQTKATAGAPPNILNHDQWHAYPESRERLMNVLRRSDVENVVVLSGDVHSSWAHDLPSDPANYDPLTGRGSVGVELVTPGLTSGGFPGTLGQLYGEYGILNRHIKYADLTKRGYLLLDVTAQRIAAEWRHFDAVSEPQPVASRRGGRLTTFAGRPWLTGPDGAPLASFEG